MNCISVYGNDYQKCDVFISNYPNFNKIRLKFLKCSFSYVDFIVIVLEYAMFALINSSLRQLHHKKLEEYGGKTPV